MKVFGGLVLVVLLSWSFAESRSVLRESRVKVLALTPVKIKALKLFFGEKKWSKVKHLFLVSSLFNHVSPDQIWNLSGWKPWIRLIKKLVNKLKDEYLTEEALFLQEQEAALALLTEDGEASAEESVSTEQTSLPAVMSTTLTISGSTPVSHPAATTVTSSITLPENPPLSIVTESKPTSPSTNEDIDFSPATVILTTHPPVSTESIPPTNQPSSPTHAITMTTISPETSMDSMIPTSQAIYLEPVTEDPETIITPVSYPSTPNDTLSSKPSEDNLTVDCQSPCRLAHLDKSLNLENKHLCLDFKSGLIGVCNGTFVLELCRPFLMSVCYSSKFPGSEILLDSLIL